jgi:hypothetical protein
MSIMLQALADTIWNVRSIIAALPTAMGTEECRTQDCALLFSSPFCPKTSRCPGHQPSTTSGVSHGSTAGLEIENAFRECLKIALFMMERKEKGESPEVF